MISGKILPGTVTSLWYDYWLPDGKRFIDSHTIRTLTSTGLPWTARVSDIIIEGQWNFPWDVSILHATWNSILFQPNIHTEDHCVWTGHTSGTFTIASAWELLREKRPINNLHHLLWFPGHIPRQSFIMWLACLGRLQTMDRLNSVGIIDNNICILCGHHTETHEHLFFKCTTSHLIWQTVNAKANMQWPIYPWQHLIRWASSTYQKKNTITHLIPRLLLSSTVYFIWHERNNRVFNNTFQSPPSIAEAIFQHVRLHITTMEHKDSIPSAVQNVWGLLPTSQSQGLPAT